MAGADKEIYVVGCGPSLRDFDWRVLAGRTTIAVNGALRDVPGPSFFITGDSGFAVSAAQNDFWGVETRKVLVMREDHRYWPRVRPYAPKYDHRIRPARFDGEIGLSEADFATGRNSGFCGMQYAAILGARVIQPTEAARRSTITAVTAPTARAGSSSSTTSSSAFIGSSAAASASSTTAR